MNERFDPDGSRRPLNPGELATADQIQATFDGLTPVLRELHHRLKKLMLESPENEDSKQQLAVLQKEVFASLTPLFLPEEGGSPRLACSYIMYLVDLMNIAVQREIKVANAVTKIGILLVDLNDDLGLDDYYPQQDATFVTGTGQNLENVHLRENCQGPWCVIHRPIPGPWSQWPTDWRGDGPFEIWRGFERICPCGKGHPAVEEVLRSGQPPRPHACCACRCSTDRAEPIFNQVTGELEGYR